MHTKFIERTEGRFSRNVRDLLQSMFVCLRQLCHLLMPEKCSARIMASSSDGIRHFSVLSAPYRAFRAPGSKNAMVLQTTRPFNAASSDFAFSHTAYSLAFNVAAAPLLAKGRKNALVVLGILSSLHALTSERLFYSCVH